ncbi:hypothetical protein ACGFZS_09730 [Streptomyces sp. NPDC048288]|uniref:hypothetical protein n=1 Tax=Streptomyces sp. NPDC048288 TaxID=3365529 RepID=UPI00371388AD
MARHDNLAANLGCAGCELRDSIRAVLLALSDPAARRAYATVVRTTAIREAEARNAIAALGPKASSPATAPRLLACGFCYEEQGEEVHPHPECPIGSTGSALREQLAAVLARFGDVDQYAMADAVLAEILPNTRILASLARTADADINRVIDLFGRWTQAGPPPLGTSMSRWWDQRLVELRAAILGPGLTEQS